jgi:hypothetical protein
MMRSGGVMGTAILVAQMVSRRFLNVRGGLKNRSHDGSCGRIRSDARVDGFGTKFHLK